MRIIFFGTGKFGIPTLEKLLASDHQVLAVVTQPDRGKGRGHKVLPTSIKTAATEKVPEITILQPEKASDKRFINSLQEKNAEVFVVVDYGQILTQEVLTIPDKYCINLHPSLLPKYRGASPVNRTIQNGEIETGNTVIKMSERMDAGSIIAQDKTSIGDAEDALDLIERLSLTGGELIINTLSEIENNQENFTEQNEKEATYADKLKKKRAG